MEMETLIFTSIRKWIPPKNLNSSHQPAILKDFQNKEHCFTIPESYTQLAKKWEDEEEHRKLESVMPFTQKQKGWIKAYRKCGKYIVNLR